MGRRIGPDLRHQPPAGSARALATLCLMASALAFAPAASHAASPREQKPQTTTEAKDRLLLQAQELIYDKDANTIEARGQVQIYYQGRALQADKVLYDRNSNRVHAQGNAKLTEKDGTVSYADRFELTDDFKEGFVDSIRTDSSEKTHMTGARAERSQGNVMVLDRATYTACPACEDDPDKPPFWQVRAKRLIHNKEEQTIYYEDASLEFLGVPVIYVPFLSMADPSVKRKSGVLAPRYTVTSNLGVGLGIPIFWALAPNYDLTLTPNFYSKQGLLLNGEWRHQLTNGAYNLRASGIFQNDPGVFLKAPYGPGDRSFRGSVQSAGQFMLNDKWRLGWDGTYLSDRWFLRTTSSPPRLCHRTTFARPHPPST